MKRIIFIFILIAAGISLFLSRSFIPESKPVDESQLEVIAENLEIPWEIEFLPGGDIIFTERPGRVRILNQETHEVEDVAHIGEGGLLGMALHPDFRRNNFVYLYYTYLPAGRQGRESGKILNKVERFRLTNNSLQPDEVIIDNITGAVNHDGGRIKFGPDKKLYITTGDAGDAELAQDRNSLAGKILRLNEDGSVPPDNPFGNPVWSYGHRNPQGLA